MSITNQKYWQEVISIVDTIKADYEVTDADHANECLIEYLDGHEFVIYNFQAYALLGFTDNQDYAIDNGLIDLSQYDGFYSLCSALAYWAFYADIVESAEWQEFIESLE